MADTKITGLASLGAAPAIDDLLALVDISDTSMAGTGTDKKMLISELFTSPTITGITNALGINMKSRQWVDIRHKDFLMTGGGLTATTTGDITTGTNTLVVASAANYAIGNGIYVVGAGAGGAVLETTITNVVGTTITLNTNAGTTVTGAVVGHSETFAIQAAIDYASSTLSGGIVFVPGGTYMMSQIKLKQNVWLVGTGYTAILKSIPQNAQTYMIVNNAATDFFEGVFNLSFDGNKSASGVTCGGISFDHTGQTGDRIHRLFNLYMTNIKGDGIHMKSAARACTIQTIEMYQCDGYGITFDSGATDNQIQNLSIGKSGLSGVYDQAANNKYNSVKVFLSGQVDFSTNGDGFRITAGAELVGCEAQSNKRHGFNLTGTRTVVEAAYCDSNAGDAFKLDGATDCRVRGHVVYNNPDGIGPQTSIVNLINAAARNSVDVTWKAEAIGAVAPVQGTAISGNDVKAMKGGGIAVVTYGATVTADPYLYDTAVIALTGNITLANPTYAHAGQRLTFILTQDATGGRTVTLGTAFLGTSWAPALSPSQVSTVMFEYDGTTWQLITCAPDFNSDYVLQSNDAIIGANEQRIFEDTYEIVSNVMEIASTGMMAFNGFTASGTVSGVDAQGVAYLEIKP